MKIKARFDISPEMYRDSVITDERLQRELVRRIFDEMTDEQIHRLFTFTKIDPNSEESERLLMNPSTPLDLREEVLNLKEQCQAIRFGVIRFRAELEVDEFKLGDKVKHRIDQPPSVVVGLRENQIEIRSSWNGSRWVDRSQVELIEDSQL